MNQLAQVALNFADEQERASEMHELFRNVGFVLHFALTSIRVLQWSQFKEERQLFLPPAKSVVTTRP